MFNSSDPSCEKGTQIPTTAFESWRESYFQNTMTISKNSNATLDFKPLIKNIISTVTIGNVKIPTLFFNGL